MRLNKILLVAALATSQADARPVLDVDNDGQVMALTDGLLIMRHMFGFRGDSLISGTGATDAVAVDQYITSLSYTPEPEEPEEPEEETDGEIFGLAYTVDNCPFTCKGEADTQLEGDEGARITMFDPQGFHGDTHGTRTFATMVDYLTTGIVHKVSEAANWYRFGDTEVSESGFASMVDHFIAIGESFGIITKSWDSSPMYAQHNASNFTQHNGHTVFKNAAIVSELIEAGNSLYVASMENMSEGECSQESGRGEQGLYFCGELDTHIVKTGTGLNKAIFVSTIDHQSWIEGDMWSAHVVRVDASSTSHATPIVAAAAAHLAKALGLTDAEVVKQTLIDYTNSDRVLDLEAIYAL